jgi:hypothetical protein
VPGRPTPGVIECVEMQFLDFGRATTMQRILAVIAITTSILGGAEPAQADVSFSDGTFSDSDWTVPQSHDLLAVGQVGSGGNPGSYRQTRISFNEQFDFAANLNLHFVYNPSTQGAVTGLTLADDLITTNAMGGSYYPLIRQAGILYDDLSGQANATSNVWLSHSRTLSLGDFTRLDGGAGSPNFTSTGSAIEFGYLAIVTGGGFFESDTGIDNYSLTVSAAAVPEPSSLVLAVAGVVIIGVARLAGGRHRWRQFRGGRSAGDLRMKSETKGSARPRPGIARGA